MKRHARKEVRYSVWKFFTGEGWCSWGDEHSTLAAARRDLAKNYRGHPGDEGTFQIVKVTLERMSSPKQSKRYPQ